MIPAPRIIVKREFKDGQYWWYIRNCRCIPIRGSHSHRRFTAEAVWAMIARYRNQHDRIYSKGGYLPEPPRILTNEEAVAKYGTGAPVRARIN